MAERKRKKTKFFTNDVRSLLYAFGDVANPLPETVSTLEDILISYVIDTVSISQMKSLIQVLTSFSVMKHQLTLRLQGVKKSKWKTLNLF